MNRASLGLPGLLFAMLTSACGGTAPTAVATCPAPHSRDKPRGSEAREASATDRLALFDAIVLEVHTHHQFSDAAFARRYRLEEHPGLARERWDADLPHFRRLFEEASDQEALVRALVQLNESLLDGHCHFTPLSLPPARLLPLSFRPLLDGAYERFVVTSSRVEGIEPGDELVSFDGVAASELLAHEAFRTASTNLRRRAEHIAAALPQGLITTPTTQTEVRVAVRHAGTVVEREVSFAPASREVSYASTDAPMPAPHCPAGDIDYGHGYGLASTGRKFCLYTSSDAAYRDLPIVRYFSFMYADQDAMGVIAADHDHLDQALSRAHAAAPLRGLVLDLRENRGGVNPYFFQDFFTTRPYPHHIIEVPLSASLSPSRIESLMGPEEAAAYQARLQALTPSEAPSWRFPFLAPPEALHAPHTPVRTLEVVQAGTPVAVLTGFTCASSCDTVASWFARGQLGPVIGEEPALAFTTLRLPIEIAADGWGPLGTFRIAFSRETLGFDGETVEGRTYPIHAVPETEENHAVYSARLIDEASSALPARTPSGRR
jgi:hypothetical protein